MTIMKFHIIITNCLSLRFPRECQNIIISLAVVYITSKDITLYLKNGHVPSCGYNKLCHQTLSSYVNVYGFMSIVLTKAKFLLDCQLKFTM